MRGGFVVKHPGAIDMRRKHDPERPLAGTADGSRTLRRPERLLSGAGLAIGRGVA
jgi:hypothetical protein